MLEEALLNGMIQGGTSGMICYMLINYTNKKLDTIIEILEKKN